MNRLSFAVLTSAFAAVPLVARAAEPTGKPTAAEEPFVTSVSADLNARFKTIADATKAGFLRYTDEDDTGAISYANRMWTSADEKHPSQLWFDAGGRLIGADFSVPYAATRPDLFGLDPSRWQRFGQHIHYGLAGPNGTTTYGDAGAKKFTAAGGDPTHPTPKDLVTLGVAKTPADVRFVFEFPAIWDVSLWLIPNENGAFADKNPAVKPTTSSKPGSM